MNGQPQIDRAPADRKARAAPHLDMMRGVAALAVAAGHIRGLFFADFAGHIAEEKTQECLKELRNRTASLKVLGSYPRAEELP